MHVYIDIMPACVRFQHMYMHVVCTEYIRTLRYYWVEIFDLRV
jgi:hypothetical protein